MRQENAGESGEETMKTRRKTERPVAWDIEAVITSYNQGNMIWEALDSIRNQTVLPAVVRIVDDGSTDAQSIAVLQEIEKENQKEENGEMRVFVHRQDNAGVSSARNAGIAQTKAPFVLILDGDDRLEPSFLEKTAVQIRENPYRMAVSSWMQTFGILEAQVHPSGGTLVDFLSKNCCPATHLLRRAAWESTGGYDENMKSGFEDWEFFIHLLETHPQAEIGIVKEPLIDYRTAPVSSNVTSMEKRIDIMRYMIEKHKEVYQKYVLEVLLDMEKVSMTRLSGWEQEMLHTGKTQGRISQAGEAFLAQPSYGDGGMAAAVRIVSAKLQESQ